MVKKKTAKNPGVVAQKLAACAASGTQYWLMKSEPDAFSIDDLKRRKKTAWDGVRNYQARNMMTDHMKVGDRVLFYHSNAVPPGVVGTAKIVKKAAPDVEAWNPESPYYDPKSPPEKPRWFCVTVGFESKFKRLVPLNELKETPGLDQMLVIMRGQRLSIQPCTENEFNMICQLGADG